MPQNDTVYDATRTLWGQLQGSEKYTRSTARGPYRSLTTIRLGAGGYFYFTGMVLWYYCQSTGRELDYRV